MVNSDLPSASSTFELRDVPGKGQGVIALANMPRGTRILAEAPLITINKESERNINKLRGALVEAFNKLSMSRRGEFIQLHNAFPQEGTLLGIYYTNAFGINKNKTSVFFPASRFNHSCRPNAR
jgi:hypothetical protein